MRRSGWLAALLAAAAVFGLHRIVDPDLFQQIATGRRILADPGSIGRSDFIAAFPGRAYVEDKWLFSAGAALVEKAAGIDGLTLLQIALVLAVAAAWWVLMRAAGARPAGAAFLGAAGLAALAFRLEARPETASHALLALAIALPLLPREALSHRARLIATAALSVAWVNLHGYFLNGLLVLAAAALAAALGDRRVPPLKEALALLAAGVAASVLHPQGLRALAWPVEQLVQLRGEAVLRESILEFFPTSDLFAGAGAWRLALLAATLPAAILLEWKASPGPRARLGAALAAALPWIVFPPPGFVPWPYRMTLALFLAALVLTPGLARGRRWFLPILLAGFSILAWPLVRNMSLLAPVSLAILAAVLGEASAVPVRSPARLRPGALPAAVALAMLLAVAWARGADRLAPGTARAPGWAGWGIEPGRFPQAAAAFLVREGLPRPILNTFDAGGYLLSASEAGGPVFIAGNTSQYPASWLAEYRDEVMGGDADPGELNGRYGIRTIVLEHAAMDTPKLVSRLSSPQGRAGWALVFLDWSAAVWVRREEGRKDWIAGHELGADAMRALAAEASSKEPDRSPLPGARRRLFPALNAAVFLRAAGRPALALEIARTMAAREPAVELATFAAAAAEEAGNLPDLVPFLEESLGRFPDSPLVASALSRGLYIRAVSSVGGGSRADLERAMILAPDSSGPPLALARLEADAGRIDAARGYLMRALSLDTDGRVREFVKGDSRLAPLLSE